MLDIFCESGPQFILQLCIILGNTQWSSMDTIGHMITSNPYSTTIKALTLLTSFSSLLLGASSVCRTLPHIKMNLQEDSEIPQYSWRKRLIIFVCLIMTVGPRLLTLSIFFGSCQLLPGLITFSVFALVYTIIFLSFTFVEYERLKPLMNTNACNQTLVLAFFASIFSPCTVLNPKTRTLLYSSIASTLANLILLLFLILFPSHLKFPQEQPFKLACYSLIGSLLLSIFFSCILQNVFVFSQPKKKKVILQSIESRNENEIY